MFRGEDDIFSSRTEKVRTLIISIVVVVVVFKTFWFQVLSRLRWGQLCCEWRGNGHIQEVNPPTGAFNATCVHACSVCMSVN